jgi:predicted Zn-dependent protease
VADGVPVTITRFENRTGDASLDSVGQMLTDALRQELPRLPEVMSGAGTGYVPVTVKTDAAEPIVVSGTYYLDGPNLRIQASLTRESGGIVHTIEPATGPRGEPGAAVDLAQQRILGAAAAALDPNLWKVATPPLYGAYKELKACMFLFADDPATGVAHCLRATEIDPGFFMAWYAAALSYSNMGDVPRARAVAERMRAMNDGWSAKERLLLNYVVYSLDGRLQDALTALRQAEALDPADLSTNYLLGFYLLRLNRPQETIDLYARVHAASWDAVTVGTWRYARLAAANHLLGRHEEELRLATIARGLFPASFLSRNDQLIALAALGRFEELRRGVEETQTLASSSVYTPGLSMRIAAEELRAHGYRRESIELAQQSAAWYRNRPAEFQAAPANRLSLAQSLYVAEEWAAAREIVSALVREAPANVAYTALAGAVAARAGDRGAAEKFAAALANAASVPGGVIELRRAQLAALLGERDQAVSLLRDAFARGLSMSTGLHRHMDLESLRGFAPFDELMKPKG